MNNYFINITKSLNLKPFDKSKVDIYMFENHISIKKIHETFPNILPENFHFKQVLKDQVRKKIRNLNVKKSSTYGSIPSSILKQCVDAYLPYVHPFFYKQSIFDPRPENCLNFSKKSPPKIV